MYYSLCGLNLRVLQEMNMWVFRRKGPSEFSASSTAEEVTQGIDAAGVTAIVTGYNFFFFLFFFPPWLLYSLLWFRIYLCEITGASSGIGAETTRVLALRGVHVIMADRNMAAGRDVKVAIVMQNPAAKVDVMELDLSSLASVRKFASDFTARALPLNILM